VVVLARRSGREVVDASKYREMSAAEFFARHKELAGFANPVRALYQTVRELVENSLDATDGYRILPSIQIVVRRLKPGAAAADRVLVEVLDNGVGVPVTVISQAFGKVLYSSKYVIKQSRGMYGLGVKAAVLYSQMTTGQGVWVASSTRGSGYVYYRHLLINMKENEPVVLEQGQFEKTVRWHGTLVRLVIEGDWSRARGRVLEYIKRTLIITPYAEVSLVTPDGEVYYYPRRVSKMPQPPREAKPHHTAWTKNS